MGSSLSATKRVNSGSGILPLTGSLMGSSLSATKRVARLTAFRVVRGKGRGADYSGSAILIMALSIPAG